MRIYLLEFQDGNRWVPYGAVMFDSEKAYKKLAEYKRKRDSFTWRVGTYRSEQ